MKLDEILGFLLSKFPMCNWKIIPMKWREGEMISWNPTDKFSIEIALSHFAKTVHNGDEFISVDWNDKKEQSGGAYPCENYELVENVITRIITRYNPKLFEEQQLTLF